MEAGEGGETIFCDVLTLTGLGPFGDCFREECHEFGNGGALKASECRETLRGGKRDGGLNIVAQTRDGEQADHFRSRGPTKADEGPSMTLMMMGCILGEIAKICPPRPKSPKRE